MEGFDFIAGHKFTLRTKSKEELDANRCKAYQSIDKVIKKDKPLTHWYLNRKGEVVECFIQDYSLYEDEGMCIVTNVNGCNVYLAKEDLNLKS